MKTFVIVTESSSGDEYFYQVKSKEKPNKEQLQKFLEEHSNDKEEDEGKIVCYEYVEHVIEINEDEAVVI